MKDNPRAYTLLCIFAWLGTALTLAVELYMLHFVKEYPGVEKLNNNVRLMGILLMVWLLVSVFLTVRCIMGRKK